MVRWLNRLFDVEQPLSWGVLCALGALSGAMLFLAWPNPSLYLFVFCALVPLLIVVNNHAISYKKVWLSGHLAAFVLCALGFCWVEYVMEHFGELPVWLSWVLFVGYALIAALNIPIFAVVQAVLNRRYGPWANLLVPVTFILVGVAYPQIFPWYYGCPMIGFLPFVQSADLVGVHGASFLVLSVNAVLVLWLFALLGRRGDSAISPLFLRAVVRVVISLLMLNCLYGWYRMSDWSMRISKGRAATGLNVAIIQASVRNEDRRGDEQGNLGDAVLDRYIQQTQQLKDKKIDLVVWPEVAVPRFFLQSRSLQERLFQLSDGINAHIFFGALRSDRDARDGREMITNSSFLIGPRREYVGFYDKVYLLMFGEYVPFSDYFPKLKTLVPAISDFRRGSGPKLLSMGRVQFAPIICYESIVVGYIQKVMQLRPEFLVNLTNDSWFGTLNEPEQHLMLTRFRAIEHRVPIVRAVNTGISAVVDQRGRIVGRSRLNTVETLSERITIVDKNETLYTRWGDWFLVLLAMSLMAFVAVHERQRRSKGQVCG